MHPLRALFVGSLVSIYLMTGFVSAKHLLAADRRDNPGWYFVATTTWPVLLVSKLAADLNRTPMTNCCTNWQGEV